MTITTELILIRHAPALNGGRLCGRRDVPASLPSAGMLSVLQSRIGRPDRLAVSPALRCSQTAEALFPATLLDVDPRLWEQDFGEWEDADPASLPDPGPLDRDALMQLRPPGGESYADLYARCAPALEGLCDGGRVAVVAHAGVVRVALSLALGAPSAGLAFEVAPLSLTRLRNFGPGQWAVTVVNEISHL